MRCPASDQSGQTRVSPARTAGRAARLRCSSLSTGRKYRLKPVLNSPPLHCILKTPDNDDPPAIKHPALRVEKAHQCRLLLHDRLFPPFRCDSLLLHQSLDVTATRRQRRLSIGVIARRLQKPLNRHRGPCTFVDARAGPCFSGHEGQEKHGLFFSLRTEDVKPESVFRPRPWYGPLIGWVGLCWGE